MRPAFAWTEAITERAVELYRRGLSASQIMIEIGAPSRNVVCGKLARLGTQRSPTARREPKIDQARPEAPTRVAPAPAPAEPQAAAPIKPRANAFAAVNAARKRARTDRDAGRLAAGALDIPATAPAALPTREPIRGMPDALLALRLFECRWPVGDVYQPAFHFCRASTGDPDPERPYCDEHRRMATTKPREGEQHGTRTPQGLEEQAEGRGTGRRGDGRRPGAQQLGR